LIKALGASAGAAEPEAPTAAAVAAALAAATASATADGARAAKAQAEALEAQRRRIEAIVSRRAPHFELSALLETLLHLGYRREEMIFASHISTATQHGAVHSIEFRTQPMRMAVVTLNLGLLSAQSPLPAYFTKFMDSGDVDEVAFQAFIGFFDHVALQGFLESGYPEQNALVYKDWEQTKRNYLLLLGLRSLSTQHWLFQIMFPELGVTVDRGTLTRSVRVEAARLGKIVLGGPAALGGISKVPVSGFDVNLFADEETTPSNRPWAEEVGKRLDATIFPLLREADLDMKITLTIRSQRGWVRIGPGNYLGFDRLKGGGDRNRMIVIHKGQIPGA